MAFNDSVADMLTRIRNAVRNRAKSTNEINSKVCRGIAQILQEEGYIEGSDDRGRASGPDPRASATFTDEDW
ncbi:MAG: 30S ribosomal protein S8 [Phycisphaerales bacterium]